MARLDTWCEPRTRPMDVPNAAPDSPSAAPDASSAAPGAPATCANHPEHVSVGTCVGCGKRFCAACRAPEGRCTSCFADEPLRDRVPWWVAVLILVFGGVTAQLVGAIPVVVGVGLWLADHAAEGVPADLGPIIEDLARTFWVLGPSIVLTGGTMVLFAVVTPILARVPLKKALGLNGAPWPAFIAAPIGILSLGPTSDFLRRMMQEYLPWATLGALEGLDAVARAAPLWVVVPAMALVPGIAEELLFRGLFQRTIKNGALAVILSGTLFSFYHVDPQHVVAVLPLGFFLAWLAFRTDSLFVPITGHVFNNAAAVIGSVYLSDAAAEEALDWWFMPIGWAVCAIAVAVVVFSTRKKE